MKNIKYVIRRIFKRGNVMNPNEQIEAVSKNLKYYTPKQLGAFLAEVGDNYKVVKNNKKISYYNIPCAFDIETTSTYMPNRLGEVEKASFMYEWTLGINWVVMVGRTWEEFIQVCNGLVDYFQLSINHRLLIYVHNLSFEFQSFRTLFNWDKVFSIETRKPVQAVTKDGIEFRCSYLLSGYSLNGLGKNLHKYKVEKMLGDLDYSLDRHYKTPLTEKELRYCLNDVLVVMAYIQERIEIDGSILKIPLTKTGYVRNYCREQCLYEDKGHRKNTNKYHRYRRIMEKLTVDVDEYRMLKEAFAGGFTHANPFYSRGVFHDVHSFDFNSAYPAVMLTKQFPMSKGEVIKIENREHFEFNLDKYCCLFEIEFRNIRSKEECQFENYISVMKCRESKNVIENNGRLWEAEKIVLTITEQDYFIIEAMYNWDEAYVGKFIRYKKDYLPTDFIRSMLDLYRDKTQLKGIKGKEVEYALAKERLNSMYGMCVTDICRDEILYEEDIWGINEPDVSTAIDSYNKSKRRFLFYPWGVWVTAYNRLNLFTGIKEFGDDYIYSDTDSIKVQNIDEHMDYIKEYNSIVVEEIKEALKHHNLEEYFNIYDSTGKPKYLGVWDYEGVYSRFKTLGAKRYMTEKDGKISLTVSGVNKNTAVPYLIKKYGDKVFEAFDEDLEIPAENDLDEPIYDSNGVLITCPTGKLTHTYIDTTKSGMLYDYLGNLAYVKENTGTHLENASYSLSLAAKYVDFLLNIINFEK